MNYIPLLNKLTIYYYVSDGLFHEIGHSLHALKCNCRKIGQLTELKDLNIYDATITSAFLNDKKTRKALYNFSMKINKDEGRAKHITSSPAEAYAEMFSIINFLKLDSDSQFKIPTRLVNFWYAINSKEFCKAVGNQFFR